MYMVRLLEDGKSDMNILLLSTVVGHCHGWDNRSRCQNDESGEEYNQYDR